MDIAYAVKQLDHELRHLEVQIREKKEARAKLHSLLSPQEKVAIENASDAEKAPPKK